MNKQEVHGRLITIATTEDTSSNAIEELKVMRESMFNILIKPLDDAIGAMLDGPKAMRESLKQDILDYVAETGDTDIHDLIDFRRKTRWQYDKAAALEWAQEHAHSVVRIKESLDVRSFEKILDTGVEFDAEKVATPEVAIKKLSHLLD